MSKDIYKKKEVLALPMTNPKLLLERVINAVGVLDDRWEDFQESITSGLIELHTNLYQQLSHKLSKQGIALARTYNGVLIGSMAVTQAISKAIEVVSSEINQSTRLLELINKSEFFQLLNTQLDDIVKSLSLRINQMGKGFNLTTAQVPVSIW